jgi:hypothetical protein
MVGRALLTISSTHAFPITPLKYAKTAGVSKTKHRPLLNAMRQIDLSNHLLSPAPARHDSPRAFSVWTEFTLQCEPVRGVNFLEECQWSHTCLFQASRRGVPMASSSVNCCPKTGTVQNVFPAPCRLTPAQGWQTRLLLVKLC